MQSIVWSLVSSGVEVCFRETGEFLFLDAATSPRAVSSLEGYLSEGMTCTEINRTRLNCADSW